MWKMAEKSLAPTVSIRYAFLSVFIPSSLQLTFKHGALSFIFTQQPGTAQGHLALDFQQLTYSPQKKISNHLISKMCLIRET